MPNEMKFEVKFVSADLQELVNLNTDHIVVTGTYYRDISTREWVMSVKAKALTDGPGSNELEAEACPMPC